jgi:hypothetical protein
MLFHCRRCFGSVCGQCGPRHAVRLALYQSDALLHVAHRALDVPLDPLLPGDILACLTHLNAVAGIEKFPANDNPKLVALLPTVADLFGEP